MQFFVIAFTLYAIGSVRCASSSNPIIDLGYVKYKGTHNATSQTNEWYGIRYAQPPVGELRWQAPQDIESHNNYTSSILDATTPGPACAQGFPAWLASSPNLWKDGIEDCLRLDVMVPAKPASKSLPVMVQIHGGGYTVGFSQQVPGNALVFDSRGDLIYVSAQYRLGAYGFLGGAEVTENGVPNAGLLDQRAAINWVQRHISAFGGDPAKITIIGGSAGGGSVINQMIMYGGEYNPPFRAVIAEYPWMQPYHNDSTLQRQRTRHGEYGYGDFYYGPYVDGDIIRDLPSEEFKSGHFTKVSLMTNREGYEGTMFSNMSETTTTEMQQGLQNLFPYAKQSFFNRLFQLYPRTAYNSTYFQRSKLFGDFIISCPSHYFSSAVSDAGNRAYKMVFDAGSQIHGSLAPSIESLNLDGTSNNATLASMIRSYYISFAVTLDPNVNSYTDNSLPHWPVYQGDGGDGSNFTVLNVTYGGVEAAPDSDASPQCDFFHSQSYVVRN